MTKIAFYKGNGSNWKHWLMHKAIKFWTRGRYSHVELIDTSVSPLIPGEWNWYSADAYTGIVRSKNMQYRPDRWDIYNIKLPAEEVAISFLKSQLGKRYDWKGILLSQIFNAHRHGSDKWFCSELVRQAIAMGDAMRMDDNSHMSSPMDLYKELWRKKLLTSHVWNW